MTEVVIIDGDEGAGDTSAPEAVEDAAESAVAVAAAAVALSEQVAASAELQAAEVMREAEEKITEEENKWQNLQMTVESQAQQIQNLAADLVVTREAMGTMAAELLNKVDSLIQASTQQTSQSEDAGDLLNSDLVTVEVEAAQPETPQAKAEKKRVWI